MAEDQVSILNRREQLWILQDSFPDFKEFLDIVMEELKFYCTEIQHDIAEYLQTGPKYLMIQAQRGQAKTTITAAYAVWSLIHDPSCRVLIVSAGGKTASDIATLIIRLINNMEMLECLRPDTSAGDRCSVEGFDIHYSLKGIDKSASVACCGVTGTLTSRRADLLIADDIESPKNSMTEHMRQHLLGLTREFSDICSTGRIIYLGTPQSVDSVYNTLPSRGFDVRIWPGRYPTPQQMGNYSDCLAPKLISKMKADPSLQTGGGLMGDQGQPTDTRMGESLQRVKELDKGQADYQLQYMLNTTLSDRERYPLKTTGLICIRRPGVYFPMTIARDIRDSGLRDFNVHGFNFRMSGAGSVSDELARLQNKIMYIDPAGGGKNGDETAYAVVGFLNSNIYVLDFGGIPGGYGQEQMKYLAEIADKHKVLEVFIEKNFGFGAFQEVFTPILRAQYKNCAIKEDMVHGQKERRIAEVLGPIIGRGSLIFMEDLVEKDIETTMRYGSSDRQLFSLFFQLSRLTLVKDCLRHDDRLDALAGACSVFVKSMAIDQQSLIDKAKKKEFEAWAKDPLGRNRTKQPRFNSGSLFNKYRV